MLARSGENQYVRTMRKNLALAIVAAVSLLACAAGEPGSGGAAVPRGKETDAMQAVGKLEYAILGGGCFWCLEAAYELLPGVVSVENGYAGGSRRNPSYEEVSSGETGHAEVVRVVYDPAKVSYEELLDLFWKIHDPTTEGRQGADIGSQYRSVIFYAGEEQRLAAEASMRETQRRLVDPIVTELLPVPDFWIAEDYHQDYFKRNPNAAYCRIVIAPKLKKAGF